MNQKKLLLEGEKKLKNAQIGEAYWKSKKLLEYVLKQDSNQLIINSLEEVNLEKQLEFEKYLQKIIDGEPIQYITNRQEFMGFCFYVDNNVLIPQPDTEILVEETIKILDKMPINKSDNATNIQILDLCTGSGCIGISLAKILNNVTITASDIKEEAILIAKRNAECNKVINKMKFICCNLFKLIKEKNYDIIVSNPPYIKTSEISKLSKEVQKEPNIALDGGEDGLNFYRAILKNAFKYLKNEGYLLLEIGFDQGESIIKMHKEIENSNLKLISKKPIKDFGGNDRILIFQKK